MTSPKSSQRTGSALEEPELAGPGDGLAAGLSLSWLIGFTGLFSMLKGARGGVRTAEARKGHTGSDEHRAHEILAAAGPHAALALVRCNDPETRQEVAAAAADSATESWDGPLTEFLAALDPGPAHDWVRAAVADRSRTRR